MAQECSVEKVSIGHSQGWPGRAVVLSQDPITTPGEWLQISLLAKCAGQDEGQE